MKSLEKSFKEAALAVIAAENGIISPQKLVHIFSDWVNSPGVSIREKLEEALPTENKALLDLLKFEQFENGAHKKSVEVLIDSVNRIKEQTKIVADSSTSPADSTSERLITDETPGRYVISGEIARGGAGRVLIALDRHLGREVAMKELLLDLKDKRDGKVRNDPQTVSFRNRFLREARVTGQLEHPSIVPVYEIGKHADGIFYYTMRMVRGKTLSKAICHSDSLESRLQLLPHFYNVCNAVAYAHSKGVINRDLKPSNVMIGEFGETVVLDWGLAKVKGLKDIGAENIQTEMKLFLDADVGKTVMGYAIGTPSYMPPEQAEGRIDDIDEISDIYSLGAILYQLLTGKPPYNGKNTTEILKKVIEADAVNACAYDSSIPPELSAIAHKAMSKKRKDRYSSVPELIEDLNIYMSGGRVKVYNYSLIEIFKRFAAKNKAVFVSSILIFTVLILSTVMIAWYYEREVTANKNAQKEKLISQYRTAQAFNEKSARLESQKQYLFSRIYAAASLYYNPANKKSPGYSPWFKKTFEDSDMLLADAASKFYHRQFHRGAVLERGVDIDCSVTTVKIDRENKSIYAACDNGDVRVFDFTTLASTGRFRTSSEVDDISFSPDGKFVAFSALDGVLTMLDVEKGNHFILLKSDSGFKCADFSKTGEELILCGVDSTLRMADTVSKDIVEFKGHTGSVNDAFFINEQAIVSCGDDGTIRIWDVLTKSEIKSFVTDEALVKVAASKDGKTIIAGSENGAVYIVNFENMAFQGKFVQHNSSIVSLEFSDDDGYFISSERERKTVVWDNKLMIPLFSLEGHKNSIAGSLFANNSGNILTAGAEGFIRIWRRHGRTEIPTYNFDSQRITVAAVSKSGWFAVASKNNLINFFDSKNEKRGIINLESPIFDVDISPDGNLISAAGWDTTIPVFDRITGLPRFQLKGNENAVNSVKFSKDGKYIASTGKDGSVRLFSSENGDPVAMYRCSSGSVNDAAFSSDRKLLGAVCDNGNTVILELPGLSVKKLIQKKGKKPLCMAFILENKKIITGYQDQSLLITDLEKNTEITLSGHRGAVTEIDISEDGNFAVTASNDFSIKLWDIHENKPVLTIPVAKESGCAAFTSDSKSIAVCDGGTMKLYPVISPDLEVDPKFLLDKMEKEAGAKLKDFYLEAGM